jgi:hypothetical protein
MSWFLSLQAVVDDVEALGVDVGETVRVDAGRLAQLRAELDQLRAATPPTAGSPAHQLRESIHRELDAQPRLLVRHADRLVHLLQPGHQVAAVEVAGILADDADLWSIPAERAIDLDPPRLQAWRRLRDLRQHLDQIEAIGEHCRGSDQATVAVDGQPTTRVRIAIGDEASWNWADVDEGTVVRMVSAVQNARLFAAHRHRAPRWADLVGVGAQRTLPTRRQAIATQVQLENTITANGARVDVHRRPPRRLTAA